ncbi:XRE family transcriptional regulator [Candidatus Parcubacteria bacterium]|nr:MAG: XRE family transcriptional regulator [Candidatus Parcubacteria bacterium]
MLTIGQLIKFGRINHKLGQDDLAKKLNVSKNYISLVENDKKDPSINFLKNTAKLLNIPLVLLIWEKIDLPVGKTKEEKEIREQIEKMVSKSHTIFAERTFKIKKTKK